MINIAVGGSENVWQQFKATCFLQFPVFVLSSPLDDIASFFFFRLKSAMEVKKENTICLVNVQLCCLLLPSSQSVLEKDLSIVIVNILN